jgi:hypothetical protein
MKKEKTIGSNPIQERLKKIRIYFTYPNDPLKTETNWYHILRARLRWLNLFHPDNKGMRFYKFYYFFKCYLIPTKKLKGPSMDEIAGVWDECNDNPDPNWLRDCEDVWGRDEKK